MRALLPTGLRFGQQPWRLREGEEARNAESALVPHATPHFKLKRREKVFRRLLCSRVLNGVPHALPRLPSRCLGVGWVCVGSYGAAATTAPSTESSPTLKVKSPSSSGSGPQQMRVVRSGSVQHGTVGVPSTYLSR